MLLEVLATELASLAARDGEIRGPLIMASELLRSIDAAGARAPLASERRIEADALRDYLIGLDLVTSDATIALQRSALGYSKDTYLICVEEPGRAARTVVIRRDLPGGPSRTTVVDEFPLISALHERGYPLAAPLFVEPDPAVLGQPFLMTEGAPGAPDVADWESDPAARRATAFDLADFLGRLHGMSVDGLPVRRSQTARDPVGELAAYFQEWRGYWDECGPADLRVIPRAFDLLEARLPKAVRLSLIHSDVGFHNILVDQGRISAVLDWEFSHLGEPEEDLAYCRPAVEALAPWDLFVERYHAAGGPAISADRLCAYQLWRGVRNATCCALGLQAFNRGLNTDLRLAYAGRVLIHQFVADVEAQMSLGDESDSSNKFQRK
jgi:aminoglycoside phosphotransferase (APT) family kinase protein